MAWKIEFDKKAKKELSDLDKSVEKRITSFLKNRISNLENPRSIGEALQGKLKNLWKYRIGNYRIICNIEDKIITIVVLRIDHRREVYKKNLN